MVPPPCREVKNAAGKTPKEIFNENHEDLFYQSEKWIKESINQSMVVATLVAAVSFSVAISIPGGYDQNKGFPLLIRNNEFIDFIISDASSFFLSSISILIFLSISISHHTVKQVNFILPKQLYLGHWTLLGSILALMGAFLRNLSTMYKEKSKLFEISASLAYAFYYLIVIGFTAVIGSTYLRNTHLGRKKHNLY
ncbi:putative PGG domain-containing protein [Helianthus anomalus]